jgi:hypothetical protein
MKLIILSFLLISIVGCGKSDTSAPSYQSYPAYQSPADSLIQEYESLFKVSVDFPVYIENEKTGVSSEGFKVLGLCVIESNGRKSVYINEAWWNSKKESDRRVLLYYELTHCVFIRGHDSRKYANGMPYSIMSPVINPVLRFYAKYERYYLNEILNPENPSLYPSETSIFITTEESCLLSE